MDLIYNLWTLQSFYEVQPNPSGFFVFGVENIMSTSP